MALDGPQFRHRFSPIGHQERAPFADTPQIGAESCLEFARPNDMAFQVVTGPTFGRAVKRGCRI